MASDPVEPDPVLAKNEATALQDEAEHDDNEDNEVVEAQEQNPRYVLRTTYHNPFYFIALVDTLENKVSLINHKF